MSLVRSRPQSSSVAHRLGCRTLEMTVQVWHGNPAQKLAQVGRELETAELCMLAAVALPRLQLLADLIFLNSFLCALIIVLM